MSEEQQAVQSTHSSVEKVQAFAAYQAEQAGGDVVASAAKALLPEMMRRLPQDPAELDAQLAAYAQLCCELRSDTAPKLTVTGPDGQPHPLPS